MSEPNYRNYSLVELYDSYNHIDRERFPERLAIIESEIKKRLNGSVENSSDTKKEKERECENQEFRLSNWAQISRYAMGVALLTFCLVQIKGTEYFSLIFLLLIFFLGLLVYEVYTLPFKVKIEKDSFIFKSHREQKRISIFEITKIGQPTFNPMYLKFTLNNGDTIKTGSTVIPRKHFFECVNRLNSKIEIKKRPFDD